MEVLGQYLSFSSSASFSSLLPLLFFNQSSFILSFRCRFKDIYGTDNYIQRLAVEAQEGGIQAPPQMGPLISTAVDRVGAVELRGGLDDDEELRYLVAEDDL